MFKERRPLGAKFFNRKATDTTCAAATTGKSLTKGQLTGLDKDLDSASGRYSGDADGFGA